MYLQTLDTMAFICSNNYHHFITIPIISYTFNSLHIYHVSICITNKVATHLENRVNSGTIFFK